ncbi:MAG TPA: divalent metal cation transporter [Candidatus Microsaccharimonas sp.]|jgi:NRAMP (natural resistance-associated macrophage protein)-like metal ion transporter
MTKADSTLVKLEKEILRDVKKGGRHTLSVCKAIINRKRYSRFLRILGPGLITGAADDDPSGIATYSQAGASTGLGLLWIFPLMYPLLLAVQESCARIGTVTGKGLAAVIKDHYSKKLLYVSVFLVLLANTINIGADLGAMAATTQLFVNIPFSLLAIFYAVIVVLLIIFVNYKQYAKILKWLALALLAYPATAFLVGQNWPHVIATTFAFPTHFDSTTIYIIVGILGTTISPYLFFWDTSEVVEEEIKKHIIVKKGTVQRATKRFLHNMRLDNFVGMTLASLTAWFIVIACSSTLFAHGINNINTAADAAKALEPLVHQFPNSGLVAKFIFSIGILGLGLLAVPVLAGSSSYALSEVFGWREGLYRKFRRARGFYIMIIAATLVGLLMNFVGIDPIKALVFSAVFNGIAAVPLLLMVGKVGNNKAIMGDYKNRLLSNVLIRITFVVMLIAVLILFWTMIQGWL